MYLCMWSTSTHRDWHVFSLFQDINDQDGVNDVAGLNSSCSGQSILVWCVLNLTTHPDVPFCCRMLAPLEVLLKLTF